jgi:hypothetical protein
LSVPPNGYNFLPAIGIFDENGNIKLYNIWVGNILYLLGGNLMYGNRENNLGILETSPEVITREEIGKFRGQSRQLYKLLILNTFCSVWTNNYYEFHDSIMNVQLMLSYRENDYTQLENERFKEKREYWCENLYDNKFTFVSKVDEDFIIDEDILNKALVFCRVFLTENLQNQQNFYLYSELKEFWDLESFFHEKTTASNIVLYSSYWIDLTPFKHSLPIYTFPDYLAYQDMINLWNDLVNKYENLLSAVGQEQVSLQHSLFSSLKYNIVAAVHFVEIYLFYFYYHCRLERKFPENTLTNRNRVRSINDKEIVQDLLFEEYDIPTELETQFEEYKKILDVRDAIVHLSPFKDENSRKSRLELTMDIGLDEVAGYLKTCFEFVVAINNVIDENFLFWLDSMETPDFGRINRINNLNINRQS